MARSATSNRGGSATERFSGSTFVVRVDDATACAAGSTWIDDLQFLSQHHVHPIVVAPNPHAAGSIVRIINRSTGKAIGLRASDAALLPHTPTGIGRVNTGLLRMLLDGGYIPVVEPMAFRPFSADDARMVADDVANAIAAAVEAVRALFFHTAGGVIDPQTKALLDELTPAETLALADDERVPADLRATMRAAALVVRSGIPAAQIIDGRIAHATILEVITARHLGTQITGNIIRAA